MDCRSESWIEGFAVAAAGVVEVVVAAVVGAAVVAGCSAAAGGARVRPVPAACLEGRKTNKKIIK